MHVIVNERLMVYSVWSHGRLLGVNDLDFKSRPPRLRAGWFHPADDTEVLMDMATGFGPALHACHKAGGDTLTDAVVKTAISLVIRFPWCSFTMSRSHSRLHRQVAALV